MSVTGLKISGCLGKLAALGVLALATAPLAIAQNEDAPPPLPPPPHGGMGMMRGPGPMGEGGGLFHSEFGEGKVVKGAPMSAQLVVTRDTTLTDGNHIHNVTTTMIYRDAEGRVRREIGMQLNTPSTGAVKRDMIVIMDPVSGNRYMLNPDNKTARQMPVHPPKLSAPSGAAPSGATPPRASSMGDSNSVTSSLGTKTISGLQAEGTRVVRTIPAGQIGNEKPIEVVTERWVSTDLQVPLLTTHTDPMVGSVSSTLTNISRVEPDASLFVVPPDYKVESGKPGDVFYMPMKH
jgi:hypothetical protein